MLIYYTVFIDVIGSWVWLRIGFIRTILDPIYKGIQSIIPTRIGMFDFTPIVILIAIMLLQNIIPELMNAYIEFTNN